MALATIISNLFESVLLLKCEDCSNQFGFKKGHNTDLCIYALKEYAYYKNRNTFVCVSMLDASKAFDILNYRCCFRNFYLEMFHCLLLEYLLCGILIKICASDGAMQFLHLLLLPLV